MIALSISEADVKLYPSDASGDALIDNAIWAGSFAEKINISKQSTTASYWPTGSNYPVRRQEGAEFTINIGRVWFLKPVDFTDFDPQPNQKYVMVIRWQDQKTNVWHRRTYKGVTCDTWSVDPANFVETTLNQTFTAYQEIRESNQGVYTDITLGTNPNGVLNEMYLCVSEEYAESNDFLLGHYSWPGNIQIVEAVVFAKASQGSSTVLTLCVNDAPTANTITIPSGTVGQAVTATATYTQVIAAGQKVRWQVTSAPATQSNCAYDVAVVMKIKPV